jgi:hypothetical protein
MNENGFVRCSWGIFGYQDRHKRQEVGTCSIKQ